MDCRTFYIETHGCQMNEHDSEKIAGMLAHRGLTAVHSLDEADLYLLNTCSVREKAAHRVYSRLGEVRRHKRRQPGLIIGVVGCVAQQESEEMVKKAPFVDLVVGTHLYHSIPDRLDQIARQRQGVAGGPVVATHFLADPSPVEMEAVQRHSAVRAHVTVMEGCNKHCAFCIVPYTRGRERNRPREAVLQEVQRAVDQGFREILLLGQTVNSYRDPKRPHYRFARLLAEVAAVDGLRRIRFTSPHPRHFDDPLIAVMAARPNVCDQVHIPLQSGSDRILRRMRRQHGRDWYLERIEKFRRSGRDIRFSTDIIVGFPGETEDDFEQTLDMVRRVEYESIFSFKYSPRPSTEAFAWPDDVPEIEKGRRLLIVQRLQRDIQLRLHRERYLGGVFEVLVEGTARDGRQRFGRTTTNKIVNFDGNHPPGALLPVRVSGVGPNSLLGQPLPQTQLAG